jgi:hypothetical protein
MFLLSLFPSITYGTEIYSSITNNMQSFIILFIKTNALNVSGVSSAIIRSLKLFIQLLMIGGGTA